MMSLFSFSTIVLAFCSFGNSFLISYFKYVPRKEATRGFSMDSQSLGFEDILSENDVALTKNRFTELRGIFSNFSKDELEGVVRRSPMLVTIGSDLLRKSVENLTSYFPGMDPAYVLRQRSAGLELLLLNAKNDLNIKTSISELSKLLHDTRDIDKFILRVPHALIPKYQQIIKQHINILNITLGFTETKAIKVIEQWPGILNINLTTHIWRLNSTLKHIGFRTDNKFLNRMISSNPRVLVYDINKKIKYLYSYFPNIDWYDIIRNYPRILSQNIAFLNSKYEVCR